VAVFNAAMFSDPQLLNPYFVAAVVFGLLLAVCHFLILFRMHSLGHKIGLWRSPIRDLALYREFWRIAPERGWSRAPVVLLAAFGFCFFIAALLLLRSFPLPE
jgi:hypothetical protein